MDTRESYRNNIACKRKLDHHEDVLPTARVEILLVLPEKHSSLYHRCMMKTLLVMPPGAAIKLLQQIANILLAVVYIFGGLSLLFPEPQVIQPMVAVGIALVATGLFGSPYCNVIKGEA